MDYLIFLLAIAGVFYARKKERIFVLAFFGGIFLDLMNSLLIGRTSLALLIVVFLAFLYGKKFSSSHFLFKVIFVFFSLFIFSLIKGTHWYWQDSLWLGLAAFFVFPFLENLLGKRQLELEL